MQIGPGWFGINSPFMMMKGLNGWGQQAFWCLNIIRMGNNLIQIYRWEFSIIS